MNTTCSGPARRETDTFDTFIWNRLGTMRATPAGCEEGMVDDRANLATGGSLRWRH